LQAGRKPLEWKSSPQRRKDRRETQSSEIQCAVIRVQFPEFSAQNPAQLNFSNKEGRNKTCCQSATHSEVLKLSQWVRRRVRLYYWKQWKQPRTRRRHLLALGADPDKVHMAMRSRKGYWRMSQNEIVRFALNHRWLEEQGVPDMKDVWIVLHCGAKAPS
jgi:hypothetical protein